MQPLQHTVQALIHDLRLAPSGKATTQVGCSANAAGTYVVASPYDGALKVIMDLLADFKPTNPYA